MEDVEETQKKEEGQEEVPNSCHSFPTIAKER